jgi:integrase
MSGLLSLPLARWPAADQAMWAGLTAADDPLGDAGALSNLRPASKAGLVKFYGRWLEWLNRHLPEALAEAPERRATPDRVMAWSASLADVAPPTRRTLVSGALNVLQAAAPDADWRLQRLLLKSLAREVGRFRSDRKTGRVLSSAVLLDAAFDLAGPGADAANTALNAALMRRDGTMVAFLALLPIRLRSFSELALGTSLLVTPSRITLALSGDMTKNHLPWETAVPPAIEPLLRRYVEEVRPWLMARSGKSHDALWVGRLGDPFAANAIAGQITIVTERLLGVPISPHLFRDAAATTLARLSPKDARLIRPLLAHSSYGIAERHYNHATAIEAGRDYAAIVAGLAEGEG